MKICSKCNVEKEESSFSKNRNKEDGLHIWCKDCANASTKKWRKQNTKHIRMYYLLNKEQITKSNKNWIKNNRHKKVLEEQSRRAKKAYSNGKITEKEWLDLLERYDYHCLCCGRNDVKLTMDHILPLNKGGLHVIENVQPLCVHCNCVKFTKTIDYRKKYDTEFLTAP